MIDRGATARPPNGVEAHGHGPVVGRKAIGLRGDCGLLAGQLEVLAVSPPPASRDGDGREEGHVLACLRSARRIVEPRRRSHSANAGYRGRRQPPQDSGPAERLPPPSCVCFGLELGTL
jgi:hypothetical protein